MTVLLKVRLDNVFQRCVNVSPLDQQLLENQLAVGREAVETLVALVLFPPLADQQALGFQTAKQRIQRALVNGHAMIGEGFAQGVAVMFDAQRRQHREGKAAAAEFLPEVFEALVGIYAMRHIVYGEYYVSNSMRCQEISLEHRGETKEWTLTSR